LATEPPNFRFFVEKVSAYFQRTDNS
jgi:hypothetical protein